jgi:hypothetical protein
MDVHKESISIAVLNFAGKVVMECVIETKASTLLPFVHGLRGDLQVTFEEGTWAGWLYDLLKPHVTGLLVWISFLSIGSIASQLFVSWDFPPHFKGRKSPAKTVIT